MDGARHVVEFMAQKQRSDYLADRMFQDAVERQLERITVSLARAFEYEPALVELLPDLSRVTELRHALVQCEDMDHEKIWLVVTTDIFPLSPLLRDILNDHGDIEL
jgi:uncharacterized protein with HEPN domain